MSNRARRIAAPALAVLAATLLLAALIGGYASRAFLNAEQFADRAASALQDDAVADEIGRRATDSVVGADPDLIAVRPVLEQVFSGLVASGAFRDLFRAAVADLHRAIFERDRATVTLTLADIGATARGALQALNPKLAKQIPVSTDARLLESDPPDLVVDAAKLRALPWILLAAAALFAGAALWLSADRRRTVVAFGVAVAIGGVVATVALSVVRALVLGEVDEGAAHDAAAAVWDSFLADLRTALLLFAASGAVITAAGSSLLRPVEIGAPLARAWQLVATVPESRGLRALRGALLLVTGILIVIRHDAVIDLIAILAGLYIAYAGVSELLRLTIATPAEGAPRERRRGATLIATGLCSLLILAAGAVFVGSGGASEEPPAIETEGCNGSVALCGLALDRVALAATHNSMSAASNPGWLFAQQEHGFAEQLHDGIRGLLIDAHYGQPTESGVVKTDLSDLDSGERATYEAELGPEALDAALRIRDRIVGSPPTGPRQVYLCHRFCELGAYPIDKAFAEFRDFLAANPDEVLVIDIEDYVDPSEIAAAAEQTGLLDYVYTGSIDSTLPTLQQMIDSGGRALMLAENDAGAGSIPWYHEAYEALLQETPYSFKTPNKLTDPAGLAASCEPNRGPADAPLFLINHWVDTSPAPRPSNARKVNARDALLDRVQECERLRELSANLIAVDFYAEGDLFGVVEELNAE